MLHKSINEIGLDNPEEAEKNLRILIDELYLRVHTLQRDNDRVAKGFNNEIRIVKDSTGVMLKINLDGVAYGVTLTPL